MTHPFTYQGKPYRLHKHGEYLRRHAAGAITDEQLAAAPWYFRFTDGGGKVVSRRVGNPLNEALAEARSLLAQRHKPGFRELLEASRARQTLTLATLATEWQGLRCPKPNGRPRTDDQIRGILPFLATALTWWGARSVDSIRPPDLLAYAAHRRAIAPAGYTGERSCDQELTQLSNLAQWALSVGRITTNPFASRPTFRDKADVRSCSQYMPASDDELHLILRWFFTPLPNQPRRLNLSRTVKGAQLLFCALTGLRPGEPGALLRPGPATQSGQRRPGARYQATVEGVQIAKMAIAREKGGQNPAIVIRPALQAFLDSWDAWLQREIPSAAYLFPDPDQPDLALVPFGESGQHLRPNLNHAVQTLGLPERHPHGMRAYYVRVRRAQGAEDATIAGELGQSGGETLIRQRYGHIGDARGDGAFDWLPTPPADPCWHLLQPAAVDAKVVTVQFGT